MVHFFLAQASAEFRQFKPYRNKEGKPDIRPIRLDPASLGDVPSVEFTDCYTYGKSTGNQRIESWWLRLYNGQIIVWRVSIIRLYFVKLIINF